MACILILFSYTVKKKSKNSNCITDSVIILKTLYSRSEHLYEIEHFMNVVRALLPVITGLFATHFSVSFSRDFYNTGNRTLRSILT